MDDEAGSPSVPWWPAALAAALGAMLVAAVQLRHGVLQILDTGSYVSGAEALHTGHGFTTTLAPSFSNFTVIEFVRRDGRLPFVDFPVGWSTLGALGGSVIGVRRAFALNTVGALGALAALIVAGPGAVRHISTRWLRAVFAVGLCVLPVVRLVTQGVLSEPLFLAVVVGLAAALVRYRADGSGLRIAVVLAAAAGLIRFVGASLAILPALEHFRRHRRPLPALGIAGGCLAPAVIDAAWARAVGGGHTNTWHGLDATDVRLVGRSLAGMLDATTGNLAATLLRVGDLLPWWGYPLAVVWLVAVLVAAAQYAGLTGARRPLPAAAEIPLVCAGLLTAALLAGIASFDALATPDNRLMLPTGVLSLCALVWVVDVSGKRLVAAFAVVAVWILSAAHPWDAGQIFTAAERLPAAAELRGTRARVIVSNDADGIYWELGIPAAYLPPPRMSLTGAPVDRAALYAELPCALAEHDGIVVVLADALFGVDGQDELDALVAEGRLDATATPSGAATIYAPNDQSC